MNRERWIQLLLSVLATVLGLLLERRLPPMPPLPQPPAPLPQPPDPPKPPVVHPIEAIGRIEFGSAGCTATVIAPRRPDGQYDVLTAWHCIEGQPREGAMRLRNGRSFKVKVVQGVKQADCAWLVTVDAPADLPTARLASRSAAPGQAVWHAGFGVHQPGNVERGKVNAGPNSEGQSEYTLSVSPGDSGGGIVVDVAGEVLSPVCCTTRLGAPGRVWGASPEACQASRPSK